MNTDDIQIVDIVTEDETNVSSSASPEPTPIVLYIDEEGREEATQYYMTTCDNVNTFLADVSPKIDFIVGTFQFMVVFLAIFLVYKLFRVFF